MMDEISNCENCSESFSITHNGDSVPSTCPFCGHDCAYQQIDEEEEETES